MSDDLTLDDLPQPKRQTTVSPDELHADGNNPNEVDGDTFELLVEKIQERGWIGNDIISDTDGTIADGEHRWRAAKQIGLSEVPVKQYDFSDTQRRLVRQELNKIRGEHDHGRDIEEFESILNGGGSDTLTTLLDATHTSSAEDILNEVKEKQDVDADEVLDSVEFQEYDESIADGMSSSTTTDSDRKSVV